MEILQTIQQRIYELRGERVMLDFDLATLYQVETRILNQSVKRNIKRFPEDFMFQLSTAEWQNTSSQIVMMNDTDSLRSQSVTLKNGRGKHIKYLPYAFTEQGIAMLSGILNSDLAINMNIAIMRAFVAVRRALFLQTDLKQQLKEIKDRLGEHDVQLHQIYDAMENMLDENAEKRKWDDRDVIGFIK
jgi:ORF6N domain